MMCQRINGPSRFPLVDARVRSCWAHGTSLGGAGDSKRQIFWALPGFVYPTGNFGCNNGAIEIFGTILTFDPNTNKWMDPAAAPEPITGQKPKNAIYDPVTDSIYRSGEDARGFIWTIYHIATNT